VVGDRVEGRRLGKGVRHRGVETQCLAYLQIKKYSQFTHSKFTINQRFDKQGIAYLQIKKYSQFTKSPFTKSLNKTMLIFLCTTIISFMGSLQPGPLNMSVVQLSLHDNPKGALKMNVGGCIPEFVYSLLAAEGLVIFQFIRGY
jgi:hypothetical protein